MRAFERIQTEALSFNLAI